MVEQEIDGSRYGLLETIKEFAHEHLSQPLRDVGDDSRVSRASA